MKNNLLILTLAVFLIFAPVINAAVTFDSGDVATICTINSIKYFNDGENFNGT